MTNFLLIFASVALAALRVSGNVSEPFQALAHFHVGGLYYAGFVSMCWHKWSGLSRAASEAHWPLYLRLALVLTFAVEVPCAVLGVGRP